MLSIDYFMGQQNSAEELNKLGKELESLAQEAQVLGMLNLFASDKNTSMRCRDVGDAMYFALSQTLSAYDDFIVCQTIDVTKFWLFGCWSPTFTGEAESLNKLSEWLNNRVSEIYQFLARDGFSCQSIDEEDYVIEEEV